MDIDDDFPLIPNEHASDFEETDIDETQGAIIWWVVAFTAIFETLHTIPTQAVIWLLKFLWCLFTMLGQYSMKISAIAKIFPSTVYKRAQYLKTWPFLLFITWLYAHTVIPFSNFNNVWINVAHAQ